eukprot:Plantae.Rhodophyta-Purpureofilum_apyrenoidigerum.ctg26913.p1 GENE.Plantae.Rhodophyta-Purpureofilum_apyrenoidigerum.ctg26913~~Plantae.Rhodophyta-Purpureofilum_apyrenoidigerum.ctg26913.p1  ORF type:complete len:178 (+),score=36.25 Plantae.Rhodophyta-Purpureofilum_apyrenoidigerum.ctg26913:241-774(+)
MVLQESVCPLCGCALGLFSPFERERHVNDCLDGGRREEDEGFEACPVCRKKLGHLGEQARERHVWRCAGGEEQQPEERTTARRRRPKTKKSEALLVRQDPELEEFLSELGLRRYTTIFAREKIDIGTLRLLTEEELCSLKIPPASRRRILEALPRLAMASVCRKSTKDQKGEDNDEA